MSLSKGKCLYKNNSLHFLKRAVPLFYKTGHCHYDRKILILNATDVLIANKLYTSV
jgi:hypothetical protein